MGHRPTFQKAVDHIKEGGVHAGRRSRMGSPQTEWESDQLHLWGDSGRLHVLADRQTPLRLVPRTRLRLQFCRRPPAIHRYQRWSPHRNSVIVMAADVPEGSGDQGGVTLRNRRGRFPFSSIAYGRANAADGPAVGSASSPRSMAAIRPLLTVNMWRTSPSERTSP